MIPFRKIIDFNCLNASLLNYRYEWKKDKSVQSFGLPLAVTRDTVYIIILDEIHVSIF